MTSGVQNEAIEKLMEALATVKPGQTIDMEIPIDLIRSSTDRKTYEHDHVTAPRCPYCGGTEVLR